MHETWFEFPFLVCSCSAYSVVVGRWVRCATTGCRRRQTTSRSAQHVSISSRRLWHSSRHNPTWSLLESSLVYSTLELVTFCWLVIRSAISVCMRPLCFRRGWQRQRRQPKSHLDLCISTTPYGPLLQTTSTTTLTIFWSFLIFARLQLEHKLPPPPPADDKLPPTVHTLVVANGHN